MKRPARAPVPPAEVLERRYRRLFACYPASYRATSEDEMLGVALAGTKPGQRWPAPGEVRSLILGGARTRLGGLLSGARTPAWRDAAQAFAFLAAALLTAIYVQALDAYHLVPLVQGTAGRPIAYPFLLAATWPLTAVAVALRWRWVAAVAVPLNLIRVVVDVIGMHARPTYLVGSWWQVILEITVAMAITGWLAGPRPASSRQASRVLPRWTVEAVAAVLALYAVTPLVAAAFTTVQPVHGGGGYATVSELGGVASGLNYGLIVAAAAVLLIAVIRLDLAVRSRVLIMALPALTARWMFGEFPAVSPQLGQPVQLTASQWAELAVLPVLGLVAGMIWLRRHDRMATQHTDAR
jgi:hypothetical protein